MNTMDLQKTNGNEMITNPTETVRSVIPLVDIYEIKDGYIIHADLPGVDRDSIKAQINNNTLVVSAKSPAYFRKDASLMFDDSVATEYHREFALAEDVDTGSVNAVYQNGVLTLTLKKKPQFTPKEIVIR